MDTSNHKGPQLVGENNGSLYLTSSCNAIPSSHSIVSFLFLGPAQPKPRAIRNRRAIYTATEFSGPGLSWWLRWWSISARLGEERLPAGARLLQYY